MTERRYATSERDEVSALGWGLRKYAWLVVLAMLALGVAVPAGLRAGSPTRYQAAAQVGPTAQLNLPNLAPLPRLGETVFADGAVAGAVRQSYNPPLPGSESVIPSRVKLVAPQDNLVFTVLGRGATPAEAKGLANVAAGTLTEELNKYGDAVGTFAIQRAASTPASPISSITGSFAVATGLLAGLLVGVGIIALILGWRRPVRDGAAAE